MRRSSRCCVSRAMRATRCCASCIWRLTTSIRSCTSHGFFSSPPSLETLLIVIPRRTSNHQTETQSRITVSQTHRISPLTDSQHRRLSLPIRRTVRFSQFTRHSPCVTDRPRHVMFSVGTRLGGHPHTAGSGTELYCLKSGGAALAPPRGQLDRCGGSTFSSKHNRTQSMAIPSLSILYRVNGPINRAKIQTANFQVQCRLQFHQ